MSGVRARHVRTLLGLKSLAHYDPDNTAKIVGGSSLDSGADDSVHASGASKKAEMRSATIRDVYFYDCFIEAIPAYAPRKSIRYFLEKMMQTIDSGESKQISRNKKTAIHIRKIEIDEQRSLATILICFNNLDGSDAAFLDYSNDKQREEAKGEEEGRPETVHLVFNLSAEQTDRGIYLLLTEGSEHLNREQIQLYLNRLVTKIAKAHPEDFKSPHPDGAVARDGQPRFYTYSNTLELKGHISDDFLSDLEAGRMTGIVLDTTHDAGAGLGESGYIKASRRQIRLSPFKSWKDAGAGAIQDAITMGRNAKYESARITFKSKDKMAHTARLDTSTGKTYSDGYVKKLRISNETGRWRDSMLDVDPVIQGHMARLAAKD